jgi:hypothetical protein
MSQRFNERHHLAVESGGWICAPEHEAKHGGALPRSGTGPTDAQHLRLLDVNLSGRPI